MFGPCSWRGPALPLGQGGLARRLGLTGTELPHLPLCFLFHSVISQFFRYPFPISIPPPRHCYNNHPEERRDAAQRTRAPRGWCGAAFLPQGACFYVLWADGRPPGPTTMAWAASGASGTGAGGGIPEVLAAVERERPAGAIRDAVGRQCGSPWWGWRAVCTCVEGLSEWLPSTSMCPRLSPPHFS